MILTRHGLDAYAQSATVTVSNTDPAHLLDHLDKILGDEPPDPLDLASVVGNRTEDKYDHYLGDDLLNAACAARSLDVPAAFDALRGLRAAVAGQIDD
ncbi:MAG: ATP-dependent helicase Lhr and Lhr-like helicase [Actinomycetota bacterium]|nr:ATP-dependent helicase Lhr and Lhr-like helicase [Actinomycetota bacterium]